MATYELILECEAWVGWGRPCRFGTMFHADNYSQAREVAANIAPGIIGKYECTTHRKPINPTHEFRFISDKYIIPGANIYPLK